MMALTKRASIQTPGKSLGLAQEQFLKRPQLISALPAKAEKRSGSLRPRLQPAVPSLAAQKQEITPPTKTTRKSQLFKKWQMVSSPNSIRTRTEHSPTANSRMVFVHHSKFKSSQLSNNSRQPEKR